MPFSMSKHVDGTMSFFVLFGGQRTKISYRRGTPAREFEDAINKIQAMSPADQKEQTDGGRYLVCDALCKVIAEWDVEDVDGNPVPIEPDALNDQPIETAFYTHIVGKLSEELATGGGQKKAS